MSGGVKLNLRRQTFAVSKTKRVAVAAKDKDVQHGRMDLFGELKALRTQIAKAKGLPPYVVFSDKSLHDMCALVPRNKDEFLLVHGVGENKLAAYGDEFLSLIKRVENGTVGA